MRQHILESSAVVFRAIRITATLGAGLCIYGCLTVVIAVHPNIHWRRKKRQRLAGWLLRKMFTSLGSGFIKAGQLLSARPDLLSPDVVSQLRQLQDRVPPFRFARARRTLEQEFKQSLHAVFKSITEFPIAAGSVAQVHRAVLHDGTAVAVKVRRPGVVACTRRDARIAAAIARCVQAVSPRARQAELYEHVRVITRGIMAQTNLRHEGDNYCRFRRNLANHPGIRVPAVFREFTTTAVLTLEFVVGVRIEQAPALHRPVISKVLRAAFFSMCFEHGFVHADLHPGNVLIDEDGRVVLLDAGLVQRLSPHVVEQMMEFAQCVAMGSSSDLVRHLRKYHHISSGVDWAAVDREAHAFITQVRGTPLCDLSVHSVVEQLFSLARRHHLRPLPETALVLLGIVANEGLAKQLEPTANMMQELAVLFASKPHANTRHHGHIPVTRLARGSLPTVAPDRDRVPQTGVAEGLSPLTTHSAELAQQPPTHDAERCLT